MLNPHDFRRGRNISNERIRHTDWDVSDLTQYCNIEVYRILWYNLLVYRRTVFR